MTVLAAATPSALWYLTRATGSVTLVLLTCSVALGIANVGRLQTERWPRFVVEGVHRNASLLAILFLVVHVVTTVLDPFAGIHAIDAVVPFVSSYRPLWLGLGAFASDLLLAIALTSVVRRGLGHRGWRATHWFAYLCWPVALFHAVGTGSDIKQVWMLALLTACLLTVVVGVWARVGFGWPARRELRGGAVVASIALPLALVAWLPGGPLAADWARRAGTPTAATASVGVPSTRSTNAAPPATPAGASSAATSPKPSREGFSASVSGSMTQRRIAGGLVELDFSLAVANPALPVMRLQIIGNPAAGGGVDMTSSAVSLGTSANPAFYRGSITGLEGTDVRAQVSTQRGEPLRVELLLAIDAATGTTTGTLRLGGHAERTREGDR